MYGIKRYLIPKRLTENKNDSQLSSMPQLKKKKLLLPCSKCIPQIFVHSHIIQRYSHSRNSFKMLLVIHDNDQIFL